MQESFYISGSFLTTTRITNNCQFQRNIFIPVTRMDTHTPVMSNIYTENIAIILGRQNIYVNSSQYLHFFYRILASR